MEITYLGHSCFKLKAKNGLTILIDPFDSKYVGLPLAKELADVLIMTHDHADHNAKQTITGPVQRAEVFEITEQGEYEIAGVEIQTIGMYHDKTQGKDNGKTMAVSIRMDSMCIVHLGDLGDKMKESQIEKLGSVDVLCIPVGGKWTIDAAEAVAVIKEISPAIVIPMHYKVEGMTEEFAELSPLENFLEKNKLPVQEERVHKLKVEQTSLPDDTVIQVMN